MSASSSPTAIRSSSIRHPSCHGWLRVGNRVLPVPRLAGAFHRTVAEVIGEVCARVRSRTRIETVALSGGVFQNMLLQRLAVARLHAAGFEVLFHRRVPANDGGLALGQAAVAWRGTPLL